MLAVTVNFTRQAFLGIAVSSYHKILLYLQFPFPSAKFGKNTVYSIPEILFWKIRNEFLIYHTWNNGISEKNLKNQQCVPSQSPTNHPTQRHLVYWCLRTKKKNIIDFLKTFIFSHSSENHRSMRFPVTEFSECKLIYQKSWFSSKKFLKDQRCVPSQSPTSLPKEFILTH